MNKQEILDFINNYIISNGQKKITGPLLNELLKAITNLLNNGTGLSAYEIAVNNGFVGDEVAWLNSLVGSGGDQTLAQTLVLGNLTGSNDILINRQQGIYNPNSTFGILFGLNTPVSAPNFINLGDIYDLTTPPTSGIYNNIIIGGASIGQSDILLAYRNLDNGHNTNLNLSETESLLYYGQEAYAGYYKLDAAGIHEEFKSDLLSNKTTFIRKNTGSRGSKIIHDYESYLYSIYDNAGRQIISNEILSNKIDFKINTLNDVNPYYNERSNFAIYDPLVHNTNGSKLVYIINDQDTNDEKMYFEITQTGININHNYGGSNMFAIVKSDGVGSLYIGNLYSYTQYKPTILEMVSKNIKISVQDDGLVELEKKYYKNISKNSFIDETLTTLFNITNHLPLIDGMFCIIGKLFIKLPLSTKYAVYEVKHYYISTGSGTTYTSVGTPELTEIYNDTLIEEIIWDFSATEGPLLKARRYAVEVNCDYKFDFTINYL